MEKQTEFLGVSVDLGTKAKLRLLAEREGRPPMSSIVRRLLAAALERELARESR